jgi:putative membrane protein
VERAPASPRFVAGLGMVLALFAVLSAIGCSYPQDFWLENVLVLVAVGYLALTYRRAPLSRWSYGLILIFLGLHEVGAHTTFAEVPYDAWTRALVGTSLNEALRWERNHYDRLVHLSYGLLLALPFQETIERRLGPLRGFACAFLPWIFVLATSSAYELIEWAAVFVFGGDLGQAYLGTQGDVWDSHKDTGLALLGATVALGVQALGRWLPCGVAFGKSGRGVKDG